MNTNEPKGPGSQWTSLDAAQQTVERLERENECKDTLIETLQAQLAAAQRERDEAAKDRDDWITSWRALQRHNERIEAELERVRERVGQRGLEVVMIGKVGHYVSAAVKEELERVRADNKALDKWRADVTVSLQRPEGAFFVDVPQHIKDLVRERDELRTLIAALPKVEGKIVAQAGYVKDRKKVYACFGSDADMTAYAAIVQHRQGMEG